MASTTIDARGTVDSSSGTGLTVSVPATFTYLPETTVQAIDASGSITYPGVYTLSNVTPAGVFLPAPSTVPGGVIVFRTLGSAAQRHFLTGTSAADLGVFITNGTTGGSKLTLGGTIGSSVALISDGRNFLQMSYSGSAPTYSNS
jgi:hypothetical protein